MCEYVIIDGGDCVPAGEAKPEQHPEPVTVEWIESSRRGWAKAAGKARDERDQAKREVEKVVAHARWSLRGLPLSLGEFERWLTREMISSLESIPAEIDRHWSDDPRHSAGE